MDRPLSDWITVASALMLRDCFVLAYLLGTVQALRACNSETVQSCGPHCGAADTA